MGCSQCTFEKEEISVFEDSDFFLSIQDKDDISHRNEQEIGDLMDEIIRHRVMSVWTAEKPRESILQEDNKTKDCSLTQYFETNTTEEVSPKRY